MVQSQDGPHSAASIRNPSHGGEVKRYFAKHAGLPEHLRQTVENGCEANAVIHLEIRCDVGLCPPAEFIGYTYSNAPDLLSAASSEWRSSTCKPLSAGPKRVNLPSFGRLSRAQAPHGNSVRKGGWKGLINLYFLLK
jgi:hypothetical protein